MKRLEPAVMNAGLRPNAVIHLCVGETRTRSHFALFVLTTGEPSEPPRGYRLLAGCALLKS